MSFLGRAIGKLTGAADQAKAAGQAAAIQGQAAQAGIDEHRRQFDALIELMQPYVTGGQGAFQAQQNLIGLGGQDAQQQAIQALQQGPQFQAMEQAGQNAILQNASATGGLRGGNTQAALGQFSPQLLSQLINQQYSQLGGLSQMGQASAAGPGTAGLQTGANIANLLGQQGAAAAGGQLAQGSVARTGFGDLLQVAGLFLGKSNPGLGAKKPGGF